MSQTYYKDKVKIVTTKQPENSTSGKLLIATHECFPHIGVIKVACNVEQSTVKHEQDSDEKFPPQNNDNTPDNSYKTPTQWQEEAFKNEIERTITEAVKQVKEGDVLLLAGGPDISPELYGAERDKNTQSHSIYDIKNIIEPYMLLTAIANGKTVSATCRGFQLLMSEMLVVFAPDSNIKLVQHLPDYFKQHKDKYENSTNTTANEDDFAHHSSSHAYKALKKAAAKKGTDWINMVVAKMAKGEGTFLDTPPNIAQAINLLSQNGLLADALNCVLSEENNQKASNITKTDTGFSFYAPTIHHQGFCVTNNAEMNYPQQDLAKAGGKINAVSGDSRDGNVTVIESATFSLEIGAKEIELIKARVYYLNELIGINIELPFPNLKPGEKIRFDAPFAVQGHLEFNYSDLALKIPALVAAFTTAKKEAHEKGEDIGGYENWRQSNLNSQKVQEIVNEAITKAKTELDKKTDQQLSTRKR